MLSIHKNRRALTYIKQYSHILLNILVFSTLCCTAVCQTPQENNSTSFIQELYKNKYGFKDPSPETQEVFHDATTRLHVQVALLEYPSDELEKNHTHIFGPPLLRFIVMPKVSTLDEHRKAYEIFTLYHELNKITFWNDFRIMGGFIGLVWTMASLYSFFDKLYPYFWYDVRYAHTLIQQDIISPIESLRRIIPPFLFIGLYATTGIALGGALFQTLFKSQASFDTMACQQLVAHGKIDILEKAIEYLKKYIPQEEERIKKLQLCKKYPGLPAWKRSRMKEAL